MAAKNNMTVSVTPTNHRPSAAQRRAAQIASVSNKQAELKREAAERRTRLEQERPSGRFDQAGGAPRRSASARRSNAR
jgi:hypothetical protein